MKLTDNAITTALLNGHHVRRSCWKDGTSLGVNQDGELKLIDSRGNMTEYGVVLFWLVIADWEIIAEE